MTDQDMGHPTLGGRRRHKSRSSVQSAPLLPAPRLADYWIQMWALLTRKVEMKRSDRSQSRLLLSLLPADPQTSTMRLWESLKWIQGKPKRFEEGIGPEFQDIEEETPKVPGDRPDSGHLSGASHGGYGSSSLTAGVPRYVKSGQEQCSCS